MSDGRTRNLIRTLVAIALCTALLTGFVAPVPEDLPAAAFGQAGLYRLEVALLVFYGGLLLITPAFSGLIWGRLPTEISARGAKFTEEADQSADTTRAAIRELQQDTYNLSEGLASANLEIERLRKASRCDKAQPAVDSRR